MKILYIHTRYLEKGGEDVVYQNEKQLMESSGVVTKTVLFCNKKYSAIKFILLLFNPFSFVKVYKTISAFNPTVIHVHNWYFGASPSIFIAAKLKRVPIVLTLHNFRILCPSAVFLANNIIYTHSINKLFPLRSILKKVNRNSFFFTFWLLLSTRLNYIFGTWSGIDKYICLTDYSKNILAESYLKIDKNKIIVKPNFVDEVCRDLTIDRQPHFLFVGRLTEAKGLLLLLAAFKNTNYSLHIIGDGPLRAYLENTCTQNNNIKYFKFQNKQEIRLAMQQCTAVIFPSICYEPFGLVIIEAFSCATPVIAGNLGGPADLIKEGLNGLQFKAGDVNDLTLKLISFANLKPQQKAEYGRNAYEDYKNKFTPENNLSQLNKIYHSLIK